MTQSADQCPNCGSQLKSSILGGNYLLADAKVKAINFYHEPKSASYCGKCGNALYEKYHPMLRSEEAKLSKELGGIIAHMPIVTTHTPFGWEFDVLGIVTGQSVAGTGITSELSSAFNDFLGTQSGTLAGKLSGGEVICMNLLRKKALDMGGNAIIAADIDYAELGAIKGMIMVCMAGTAVRIRNIDVLGKKKVEVISKMTSLNDRLMQVVDRDLE